uniref:Methyltransferase-like protein 17, mitochondrial n=1 Tax=Aceria tosichella TaxID=561515 RepID=A0A6G1SNU8_9ACAR
MSVSAIRNLARNLPARLHAIAEEKLQRYSDREFRQEAKYHLQLMQKVKLPDEEDTLDLKKAEIKTELEIRGKLEPGYDPEKLQLAEESWAKRDQLSEIIQGMLEERRRDWHYYEYDERAALMYMATRLAPNYASLKTVMSEIRTLDPDFKPRSVLDFGSGMGTTIWAINETWPKEVTEFMNVDISKEQQNLCEYLLRGGKDFGEPLQGVFHRQYLPSSNRVRYDMVVVAFSLLELPNRQLRAQTIENLWQKTNDLLVIVERGNKGGFSTVNEARNFVLDLSGYDVTKKVNLTSETRPITRLDPLEAHVLAPCPHEFVCPRALMPSKKRMDICRFSVPYVPLEIGEKRLPTMREEFSYVVVRKQPHPNQVSENYNFRWPRIVESPQRRGKHVRHKLCCPDGTLTECVVAKGRYDKEAYEIAKDRRWGEILPIRIKNDVGTKNSRLLKSGSG